MRIASTSLLLLFLALMTFVGCCDSNPGGATPYESDSLEVVESYDLDIPEPSGLTYDSYSQCLWTVSDENGYVYRLSLEGEILGTVYSYSTNLEGIAYNNVNNTLFFIDETENQILYFDQSWAPHLFYDFSDDLNPNDPNGIEGITYDHVTASLRVVSETNPGNLFKVQTVSGINLVTEQTTLDYADDYSGICVDPVTGDIWILSHESQTVFRSDGGDSYDKAFLIDIEKPEGIAMVNNVCYIVSDETNKLYKLEFQ